MKNCKPCGRDLPLSAFFNNAGRPDGKQSQCKQCQGARNTARRKENPEAARAAVNKCSAARRDLRRDAAKARYWAEPEKSRAESLERAKRRRGKVAEYMRNRRASVPDVALKQRISAQIRHAISTGKGGRAAEALVGWATAELRTHLERQFVKGMGWHNMGEWHIDHIVPLASFKITGPEDPELRRAWALTNLRPLWAKDNIKKGAKRETLL